MERQEIPITRLLNNNGALSKAGQFGSVEKHGTMLIYNIDSRKMPEKTIEYMI